MQRLRAGTRTTFDAALPRAENGPSRLSRERIYGNPGRQEILSRNPMTFAGGGTTTAPVTAATKAAIQLNFHTGEWDAAYNGTTLDAFAASLGCMKSNILAVQVVEYSTDGGENWNLWGVSTFSAASRGVKDGLPPRWSVEGLPETHQLRATLYVARDMNVGVDGEGY